MGPITLFDKSFLQSLSLDESVWFDNFFLTSVCPLFYVETLADLAKSRQKDRTAEQTVGIIADKFPEMNGTPCAFHKDLCIGNLLGSDIPMTGQIPLAQGRLVQFEGKPHLVSEGSPEADAFSRWQKRQFLEIERLYAQVWRKALLALDLKGIATRFRLLGVDPKSCKTLEDAKALADETVFRRDKPQDRMDFALVLLGIPGEYHQPILERWNAANRPSLTDFAPYAAFVFTVEIFFGIALAANLISTQRQSHRVDIAYLFYLPFCMIFVSSDRLHRQCAPLFLRSDQEYVWGIHLKADISRADAYYKRLPDVEKDRGIMSFAGTPPENDAPLITRLWDRYLPIWRKWKDTKTSTTTPNQPAPSIEKIRSISQAPSFRPHETAVGPGHIASVTIKRSIRRKKGSWYQAPKTPSKK